MSDFTSFALGMAAVVAFWLVGTWYAGLFGLANPSPADIAAKCRKHRAVAQLAPRPWPEQRVRVVCNDGSVFDAP